MSTKLNSRIIRETTEKADDLPILIELNKDQSVTLRLKGSRKHLQISIGSLYQYLSGKGSVSAATKQKKESKGVVVSEDDIMVPLSRIRSFNHVTPSDIRVTTKVNEILNDIKEEFTKQKTFKSL